MTTHGKSYKIHIAGLAVFSAVLLAGATLAEAASIGFNFSGGNFPNGAFVDNTNVTASGVAGVVPQDVWNNTNTNAPSGGPTPAGMANVYDDVSGTVGADLSEDVNGAIAGGKNSISAGTSVSWATAGNTWRRSGATPLPTGDDQLMEGMTRILNCCGGTSSFTVAGVPYPTYDVLAYYGHSNNGQTGTLTDGTTPYSFTTIGGAFAGYVLNDGTPNSTSNYARWNGLSSANVTITMTSTGGEPGFHGFQILEGDQPPPGGAAPEPGTAALLLIGMSLLGLRRRRRRR